MSVGIHGTGALLRTGDDAGGTVERDTSKDQSGDQAAWRELVARLELPSAVDSANPPWPARESLHPASAPDEVGQPEPGTGQGTPANRSRVIRPATYLSFPGPDSDQQAQGQPAAGEPVPGHNAADHNASDQTAADDAQQGQSQPQPRQHQPGIPWSGPGRAGAGPGELPPSWKLQPRSGSGLENPAGDDGLGGLVRPELGYLDYYDQEAEERYVPPPIPPLPKLDPVARGAWTALFGGPGYLFIATTLGWQVPGWAELTAIVAFVTGFVVLVSRLGDGPSRRDGPDQGAVV
jgi:hypothetical protein